MIWKTPTKDRVLIAKLVLIKFCLWNCALGFNLEVTVPSTKFIVSPAIKATTAGHNISTLPDHIKPSFFGYGLVYNGYGLNTSMYISAPKTTNAGQPELQSTKNTTTAEKAQGSIEKCQVNFRSSEHNCVTTQPSSVLNGDSFGMTLAQNEALTACSPAKVLNCSTVQYTPGYCYKSTDDGASWSKAKEEEKSVCPVHNLDIMFVLDGSGSITDENFKNVKNWTIDVSSKFNISTGQAQVGVVQYSYWDPLQSNYSRQRYLETEIELGEFSDQSSLTGAIRNIVQHGYTTDTAHALNKTLLDFQGSKRYSDKTTKKIILLLTDGEATDGDDLPATADYIRSLGITTFAVGVGNYVIEQLRIIASGNITSDERVFSVETFDALDAITDQLQTEIFDILEGGGSSSGASYEMQQAEKGFSATTSKLVNSWAR